MKLLKKTFAMLLSGAMVFTMMPSNMAYASKADLENSDIKGHWAENVLREGVSDGILKGDASGKINPDNEITRAEFMVGVTDNGINLIAEDTWTWMPTIACPAAFCPNSRPPGTRSFPASSPWPTKTVSRPEAAPPCSPCGTPCSRV